MRITKILIQILSITMVCGGVALILLSCSANVTPTNDAFRFVCDNGTADSGDSDTKEVTKCVSCNTGFVLDDTTSACRGPRFTCNNGTPAPSGATVATDGENRCILCNDYYRLDTSNNSCVETAYTCSDGTPAIGSPASDNHPVKNADVPNCDNMSSDTSAALNGNPSSEKATISIAVPANSQLWWVVYQEGNTITSADTLINDASGSGGIKRSGATGIVVNPDNPHNAVVSGLDPSTSYVFYATIQDDTTNEKSLTNKVEFTTATTDFPYFVVQPTLDETTLSGTNNTAARVTLTANNNAQLYWVLYDSPLTNPTVTQIVNDATGSGGVANSDGSSSVTQNDAKAIDIPSLNLKATYYFYAVIQDDNNNRAISSVLKFTTTGHPFVCTNGVKVEGTTTTENVANCTQCNNLFKLNDTKDCVPTVYTCSGGIPATGNAVASDYGANDDLNADIQKCASCTATTDAVHNGACQTVQFTNITIVDGTETATGATLTATASHDATLHWVVYANGTTKTDAATVVNDAADGSTVGFDRSGTSGVSLTATEAQQITDIDSLSANINYTLYAVITTQGVSVLSSAINFTTSEVGVPSFTSPPMYTTRTQTTATIVFTADKSTDLYWVIYDSAQNSLTAAQHKSNAIGSGGVDRSGPTADTVSASTSKSITVGNAPNPLSALETYHFYALLEDDGGNQIVSSTSFTTFGYFYVCDNGIKQDGVTNSENVDSCKECDTGFTFANGMVGDSCVQYNYVCDDGTPTDGTTTIKDNDSCKACNTGFTFANGMVGDSCVAGYVYVCDNGTPLSGIANSANQDSCQSCDTGYTFANGMVGDSCIADTDSDNIPDTTDIDDDNDGLIEINTIEELYNMRYDLEGESYDDEADDSAGNEGDTAGVPTAINKANSYVCGASATGTCGYELTANISFDTDGDNDGTWTESGGTYNLDSGDDNDSYFDVDSGGWEPIGDATNPFDAFFDGDNYTISGLAIQRSDNHLGLFGVVANDNTIQNLTIADSVAIYTGTSDSSQIAIVAGTLGDADTVSTAVTVNDVHVTGTSHIVGSSSENSMGGLSGTTRAANISDSSSTATIHGGSDNDIIGGLIGRHQNGTITSSYATGDIMGGDNTDSVGGLVGEVEQNATITISYATGDVYGGSGSTDLAGGLVGRLLGTVIASYATGDINGGSGNADYAGGLVGSQGTSTIQSSVIVASYATGDANGGMGFNNNSGGLVGGQVSGKIIASYATGSVDVGRAGGLVGWQPSTNPSITASYSTGNANGFFAGKLVGETTTGTENQSSYGFGNLTASTPGINAVPATGKTTPAQASGLTDSSYFTGTEATNAWKFESGKAPVLLYADYDGSNGSTYSCTDITISVGGTDVTLTCGTSELPGQ